LPSRGRVSSTTRRQASAAHRNLGFELFNSMAGIKVVHVPYKGLGPASADTIAGNITMTWDSITASAPFIKAKRLRALGIGSAKRSSLLPDVPTISESGLTGFELGSWYAIFAPAATPPEIIRALHREVVKAIAAPGMREQFAALGAEPVAALRGIGGGRAARPRQMGESRARGQGKSGIASSFRNLGLIGQPLSELIRTSTSGS